MSPRTREQRRALHAYRCVEAVQKELRDDYKARVNGLGSAVLRDGLAAALSFLERECENNPAAAMLLGHLARYLAGEGLPGLEAVQDGRRLPAAVRELPLDAYMLATREGLRALVWFQRAVQATFTGQQGTGDAKRSA
ncbi:MAG: type III-B CRISPR module-associated protein Cmr5 [Archangium sp.]